MKDDIKNLFTAYVNASTLAESEKVEERLMVIFRKACEGFTDLPEDGPELMFALGLLNYNKDNANNLFMSSNKTIFSHGKETSNNKGAVKEI